MAKAEDIVAHTEGYFSQIRTKTKPQTVTIAGVEIVVNPGVFMPATDSRLLADNIRVGLGTSFLDISTGCGLHAVVAGLRGGFGIATDINPEAVRNAQENFCRYKLRVMALESDMFDSIPAWNFELIMANGPFHEGEIKDRLDYARFGAARFHQGLLEGARTHLRRNGRLLIAFAQWADTACLMHQIENNGFQAQVIDRRSSEDGQRTYDLYEVRFA
ncbi:methyltransferase [Candidatus Daviesbacteria bacterium]|nr:methyltransferase [Candidatus Daviesbacteria bacterium]